METTSATKRKLKWTEFVPLVKKGPEDTFIVCVDRQGGLSSERLHELVAKCNAHLKVDGVLRWGSCYAGDVFELPWKHKDLAYPVMDFLLREGLSLFTQTRMCVYIRPQELKPGETCTPEWLDRTTAATLRGDIEKLVSDGVLRDHYHAIDLICGRDAQVCSHESSWLTEEGRAFVRWVVSHHKLNADSSDEEVSVVTPVSKIADADASEPPTKKRRLGDDEGEDADASERPTKKRRLSDDEGEDECVICLDKKPDTLVLPCMHCVVCHTCSEKLKKTADARVCVKCRRPLDSIEQNEC